MMVGRRMIDLAKVLECISIWGLKDRVEHVHLFWHIECRLFTGISSSVCMT